MSVKVQVILVTIWFASFFAFMASIIWGPMAERNYNAAMSPAFRWLYPARLREKEVNVRFQKGMAWFGLFLEPLCTRWRSQVFCAENNFRRSFRAERGISQSKLGSHKLIRVINEPVRDPSLPSG